MNKEKALSVAKDCGLFVLVTICAFAWWMLVLLLISFITLSVLHFTIEGIIIGAIVGTVVIDIYYVVKTVMKHRKEAEEELRKSMYN